MWLKILILEAIYQPFELKIHLKIYLLRPKIVPNRLLNTSKSTFKKSRKRVFWPWKRSKWSSHRAKIWLKNLILEVKYQPFQLKIHTIKELLRPKNDAKTIPKQLWKSPKMIFSIPTMVKNGQNDNVTEAKIWLKNLILEVKYQPFQLKIHTIKELLRPKNDAKTIPKQLWKSPKMIFSIPTMVKNGQNDNVTEAKFHWKI